MKSHRGVVSDKNPIKPNAVTDEEVTDGNGMNAIPTEWLAFDDPNVIDVDVMQFALPVEANVYFRPRVTAN
jgi:hypothetical protein